jgi:hypothetical protein
LFFFIFNIYKKINLDELLTTIYQLFRYQRNAARNNTLTFYIGLRRINGIKQWQSNVSCCFFIIKKLISIKKKVINYNGATFDINVSSVNNNNDDYCTIIQSSGGNPQSFGIYAHRCDDDSIRGYPLCRLIRMFNYFMRFY